MPPEHVVKYLQEVSKELNKILERPVPPGKGAGYRPKTFNYLGRKWSMWVVEPRVKTESWWRRDRCAWCGNMIEHAVMKAYVSEATHYRYDRTQSFHAPECVQEFILEVLAPGVAQEMTRIQQVVETLRQIPREEVKDVE